jgi:hypothetical protein
MYIIEGTINILKNPDIGEKFRPSKPALGPTKPHVK